MGYPGLSSAQQHQLPDLLQAKSVPALYEDSTNQLWLCHTIDGLMMLKLCNRQHIKSSSFWQGMENLFDVDLPEQLGEFNQVYDKITQLSPLQVPKYIASGSTIDNQRRLSAFTLTRIVPGSMVDTVDEAMVKTLANHISHMHQCQQKTWGSIVSANLKASQWPARLQKTLQLLAAKQSPSKVPNEMLSKAIELAATCTTDTFAPIMLDLRWDQFLHQQGRLSALVDLDAFVYGPAELEWVLLEYLLNEQQAKIFAEYYQPTNARPDLSQIRTPYRLLLFMMNVLGESDFNVWMHAPIRF